MNHFELWEKPTNAIKFFLPPTRQLTTLDRLEETQAAFAHGGFRNKK